MAGFGGSIKLTGESEYKRAIKEITDNLTVLSSEMKVITSQYDRNDTSTANLAKQNEVLNKKLDEQNKKLAEAKKMLNEATTAENTNAETVAKWQNEVNKAQAEVNKTTRELEKNTKQIQQNDKAVDDLGDSIQEAGDQAEKAGNGGFTVFKGILANLGAQAITSVINGMKALTSGIINVGEQAIASYADYEQLIGGVETLFKDSAGTVAEYANNAYKTAGLSANQYMETVTSFSASLLQSLGNDTEASAKYADRAIIDMADNANKMGTDISMIQNAYQGFAKQNYTMLDNLKLGYGGTKTEMERLIADANKVKEANGEMADLSIESFADITEAIHIIQTEMGITGTTAKEASTTITGSVNSMKSAWSNLLTGIADDNANFGQLIDNFVDSIMTVASNMLPRIVQTIQGMGDLVSQLLTTLIPEIVAVIPPLIESTLPTIVEAVQKAIEAVVAVLPTVAQAISNMLPTILDSIVAMLPLIIDAGVQIILALVDGIAKALPSLIPAVVQAILTIVQNLINNIDQIIDAGIQLIMGLVDGLIEAIPLIIDAIPQIIDSLLNAIINNLPKLVNAGLQLMMKLIDGIIKAIPNIASAIPQIIASIVKALMEGIPEMIKMGGELLAGLVKGLLNPKTIWNAVKGLFNGIVDGVKKVFGIHSPSKVFEDEIGKNLALGIGQGFEDTMKDVNSQMADAVQTDFNLDATVATETAGATGATFFNDMVDAFKQALSEVNIVLDDEVAGKFVTDTVERVVYN